jgi:hypothetical protein
MPDLALADQLLERSRDILDRNVGIGAVLIEQVDGVGLQPLEARVDDFADVLGTAVDDAGAGSVRVDAEAELGGDADPVAQRLERLAHHQFVGPRAIDFGGVEVGDAAIERGTDEVDRLGPRHRLAVRAFEPHAAVAEGGDFESAEFTSLHLRVSGTLRGVLERTAEAGRGSRAKVAKVVPSTRA